MGDDTPLALARALVRTLDAAVSDPKARNVVLTRAEAITAIGLVEALIGAMVLNALDRREQGEP